jgi:hypothetical protein
MSSMSTVTLVKSIPDTLYVISGHISYHDATTGYDGSRALPTFYLDSRVQGITSATHAKTIAERMMADVAYACGTTPERKVTLHVSAYAVGRGAGWL